MKKFIIANHGQSNKGKSESIKNVAKIILAKNPQANSAPDPVDYTYDIRVLITIGKIKIAIDSQGDPNTGLFDRLEEWALKNCEIILCTIRTRGETEDAVYDIARQYGYEVILVTNHRNIHGQLDRQILNSISSNCFYHLVEEILNGNVK